MLQDAVSAENRGLRIDARYDFLFSTGSGLLQLLQYLKSKKFIHQ